MSDSFASRRLNTIEEAKQKAEEAAAVIQERFPGSYAKWVDAHTLRVFSTPYNEAIASIYLESMQ